MLRAGGELLLPWSHIAPGKLADVQVLAAALGHPADDGLAVTIAEVHVGHVERMVLMADTPWPSGV